MRKIFLVISMMSVGCKTINKHHGMVTSANMVSEPQAVWTRPLEVGFEMGKYIEAESSTSRFLGVMRVSGDPVESAPKIPTLGQTSKLSANGEFAVARAVQEAKADGMYILYVEETEIWAGLVVKKSTKVRGRALKLEDFGTIDLERADAARIGQTTTAKQ